MGGGYTPMGVYQYLTYRHRWHKYLHNAAATTVTKVAKVTTMRSEPLLILILILI